MRVRRALVSVHDKTGIVAFAQALATLGVELLSTGGTAKLLRESGVRVLDVSEVTGFPEMLDGRVKTLHPRIHGGILARRDLPEHLTALEKHGIAPIDLVVVALYPFEQTVARPDVTRAEAIEQIDVGGPTMIRAAAKNHASVAVVTAQSQYRAAPSTTPPSRPIFRRPRPGPILAAKPRLEASRSRPRCGSRPSESWRCATERIRTRRRHSTGRSTRPRSAWPA